jgi:hypothetical protein
MNLLFSINSSNYKPISFRDRYFYDFYDIVDSFLAKKLDTEDKNRLLKPMLASGGQINWYGKYEGDFKRLNDCNPNVSEKVKLEFNTFIEKTDKLSSSLKNKRDVENTEWGNLIANLFQHDRIILIANEKSDWGILWGWDFMSNNENKLPKLEPTFKPEVTVEKEQLVDEPIDKKDPPIEVVKTNEPKVTTTDVDPAPKPENIIEEEEEEEEKEDELPVGTEPKIIYVERIGCLGRIKRLLRWISYRFWALFWLIIYTLLIIWLCRYCDRPNCDAYCEKLKKTKEELKDLEERVRERCDTTYVKPH